MISATELKSGKTFLMDGNQYKVLKYTHQKIGRGGATIKLSVKNLKTGKTKKKTFNSNIKVEEISTVKKPYQYLYSDGATAIFMDSNTYEQVEVSVSLIKDELRFIKEGSKVDVLLWEDKPLSLEIAPKVTLRVVESAPGVKGDTASNVYKPAKLENGLSLKVPLFINKGDLIRVDTRTGDYVERVT